MCKKTLNLALILMGILACSVSADLVGYWTFDEGTGTIANDGSGNDNHGDVVGGAQWVPGKVGNALAFDGADDMVVIQQNIGLPIYNNGTDNAWSIAMWVNGAPQNDMRVFSEGSTTDNNPLFNLGTKNDGATGQLDVYIRPTGLGHTFSDAEPFDETWHHIAWVDADGTVSVYIDGVLDGGDFNYTRATLDLNTTTIGGILRANPSHWFTGMIDDVQIYNHALTEAEVLAAMDGLAPKQLAKKPIPEDEQTDVIRDATLTWEPGEYAGTHNVYVGTSFEDVNAATTPTAAGLAEASYTMDRLEFSETYYWRVDEVNGTPDKTVFKGEVWSFTTEPYSIQIPGSEIAVTASSSANEFSLPEKLTDGSGLGEDGTHAITPETMWFTGSVDLDPWIQFEFDGIKQLDIMKIWNSNGAAESAIGWGVKDVVIEYSVDGENWTVLPDANQISRAPGLPTYAQADEIAFNGVPAKMVRLDIGSNWGGILMSYGLSEVQFTMIPAQARTPEPASGATGVQPGDTVTWRAGREVDTHTIYIGTDANAVADGTAPAVTTNTNSLDLSTMDLQLGDTYYWRVDEVNDAEETTVWAGSVWNLTIVPAVVVDDFEGYGNVSPDRPFQTWLDGFGYSADDFFPVPYGGNGTGSGIGHDIWGLASPHYNGNIMETATVINGSGQSMPLYFSGASQTDRTFAPAQDWTLGGATVLSIAVKGNPDITGNSLYAKINNTKIPFDGDLTVPIWQAWHIDLAGVGNLTAVTSMTIGVEGNGSGMILLDDILLHKTAPVINVPPAGSDMSLVAHWTLDETEGLDVADSSGYGNNGVLVGMDGSEWTTGQNAGALAFSGVSGNAASGNYVRFENTTSLQLTDSATISAWVKMNEGNDGVYMGIAGKLISGQYKGFALVRHSSNVFRLWCNDAGFNLAGAEASSDVTYTDTEWHHLAGVVDDGTSTLYVDGVKQIQQGDVDLMDSGTYAHIGKQYSDDSSHRYWSGLVDEVRIYYRALSEAEVQGL